MVWRLVVLAPVGVVGGALAVELAPVKAANDEPEDGLLVGSPSMSDDQTPVRVHPEGGVS